MAKKTGNVARNQKKQGRRPEPLWLLLVTVALIAASVYLLDHLHTTTVPRVEPPVVSPRQPVPVRPQAQMAPHKTYSSHASPYVPPVPRRHVSKGTGLVAIIIDDMGSSVREAQSLADIGVPLTFSVIPGLAKGKEVAALAQANRIEVMVHMPMEPKGYPHRRLEPNGLLMSQGDDELVRRINAFFPLVPHAVGANNHMGSRFTEDRHRMRLVMSALKERDMFFVDSMTSPASVGLNLAQEIGVSSAARSVFLDNVQDVAAIKSQLHQLTDMARRRGSAIGICHPHQSTIQALAQTLPSLREEGIRFVSVSELVR